MRKLTFVIALSILATILPVGAASADDSAPPEPTISIERTEPAVVVFLRHTGPYWTVRAKLKQVVAYTREHGITGAIYIRYGSDPTGRNASAVESEIGFIAPPDHKPEPPFQRATRGAEWVASMRVGRGSAVVPPHYRRLRAWVVANGHHALGPMIEWYPVGFSAHAGGSKQEPVSLRMPIEAPDGSDAPVPIPVPLPALVQKVPSTERGASGAASPPVAATPPVPRGGTVPLAPADTSVAAHREDATIALAPVPREAGPAVRPQVDVTPAQFVDDGSQPMAALLEGGHVEAIASRLMPAGKPIAADADLWLGQVVFRVSAAGKGIARTYPGDGVQVAALASAIKNRYRAVSAEKPDRALTQVVVRVPRGGSRAATERQSVLRDLDRLLGKIAVRAVSESQARGELGVLLDRAAAVLGTNLGTSP